VPYVLRGSAEGWLAPTQLCDRTAKPMHAGRYYDMEKKAHVSGKGPGFRAYAWLPFGWDGDRDLDLVVGTDRGGIHLRVNEGSPEKPRHAVELVEIQDTDGRRLEVPGG